MGKLPGVERHHTGEDRYVEFRVPAHPGPPTPTETDSSPASGGAITPGLLGELQLQLRFLDQDVRIVFIAGHCGTNADAEADVSQNRRARMMDAQLPDPLVHELAHL